MSGEQELLKIIQDTAKESGLSKEKIEEVVTYMATYINEGAKYGKTPKGFLRWYIKDQGGRL